MTDDDNFMALSSSAQALYLHLSMSADDDGFCNQVAISMFKAHASVQDLQTLLDKRYIYQFENGVIVIKHWRMANALRKDRYTPTAFQKELSMLNIKENGSYTMSGNGNDLALMPADDAEEKLSQRKLAYKNSSLPYSFDYKIKTAFYGKKCPICGCEMKKSVDDSGVVSANRLPTIQHNVPISKGGEHELGNISVICHQCNVSIKDTETEDLNAKDVIEVWEMISGCRLVADCLPQDSIGKGSVVQDSTGEYIEPPAAAPAPAESPAEEPQRHRHGANGWVLLTDEQYKKLLHDLGPAELERCITYVDESAAISKNKNGWKDWNLVVRRCHREQWGAKYPKQKASEQPAQRKKTFSEILAEKKAGGAL